MPKKNYRKTRKHKKSKKIRTYKRKYICVKTKKYRGGASSIPVMPTLPMVIDKNNIMYSCLPMPTS